jgi:hypothetical protein
MQKIPSPKEPRPKVPEKPKEKPSIFGERGYVESSFLSKELKKDEYYEKLGLPREKREKLGETWKEVAKRLFGELIEKTGEDRLKLQSLINELKNPGSSSFLEVRESAKKIREEIGGSEEKTKKFVEFLKEKFGL